MEKFKKLISYRVRGISFLEVLPFLVLGIIPLFISDEFMLRLLISALMFGGLAMAFDFTAGYISIVNFGYAAFWGLGAYTSAILAVKTGLSPWLGMFAGAFLAAVLGFILGLLTLRLAGIFASCMTWFVAMAMMALTANWVELTRGNSGLAAPLLLDTINNLPYYYIIFAMVVVIYIVVKLVIKSPIGLAFKAIGQDPAAAESSGVNATKYKIINFTISCMLAGLLGGFYAHYIGILTPNIMHTRHTVEIMAIAYIGGRGSLLGGLMAALIMIPLMEYLKGLMEIRLIMYGALMIVVMIFYPKGLAGLWSSVCNYIKSKLPDGADNGRISDNNQKVVVKEKKTL